MRKIYPGLAILTLMLGGALADNTYLDLSWEELLPGDHKPFVPDHDNPGNPQNYPSGVVDTLDGRDVRLPGFVVPLDVQGDEVSTMLLVPYFGACIHLPPPPSNQVVYIEFNEPVTVESIWEPIWVSGRLSTEVFSSNVGDASYRLIGELVEPYDY